MAAAVRTPTSLAEVATLSRPVTLARDHLVPVLPALSALVADGGLARGSTVAVASARAPAAATSLALALAAGPSAAGAWVGVVGRDDLGLVAAGELGVALGRLALVAEPPAAQWASVVAAMIGAFDVIVVGPARRVRAADARRLASRARERGTVLVQVGGAGPVGRAPAGSSAGLEVDLRLEVVEARWQGVGDGHGHLRARQVTVEATGRRRAARPRRARLWLPDPHGRVTAVDAAPVAGLAVAVDAVESGDAPTGAAFAGADVDRLIEVSSGREAG